VSVEDGEIVTGQNIVIPNQCPVDSDGNPIPFTNMIIVEADDDPATSFGTLKVAVTRADGVIEERFISFLH
ncbi:hypothetical protein, partial [Oleiphilus sp. HI0043]|uniref:hypothetical protein n=10 Tax=Oleiphilus TaxID=141450 RepID=UPI000ACD2AE6